ATCTTNGSATVVASNGLAPYTYLWNDASGQTTATATDLPAGSYTVTVTDANDCTASASVEVAAPGMIQLALNTVAATCDAAGSATVVASNGLAPYTYLWSDASGQTTATATDLTPGTYTVTVTDTNNCTMIGTIDVTLNCNPPCEADAGTLTIVPASSCLENGVANIVASPAGNQNIPNGFEVRYLLTSGTDLTILQISATPSFEVTTVGTYTIHTLVYDPATLDPTAFNNAGAILDLINNQNLCAALDAVGATVSIEECPVFCQIPVVESVVIIEPTCGNQDGRAIVNVFGNPANFTYTWTPNVSTTFFAENLGAGGYTVFIQDPTDPSCPIIEETFTIANANGPEVEISATTPATCNEANGTASILPFGLVYQWCNGETSNNAVNLPAGECQVTVTDPATNCTDIIEVVIDEINPLVVSADIVQQPDCGLANGRVNIVVENGSFDYAYFWEDGSMANSRNDLAAGSYRVTVTDNGPTGCMRILAFVLTDNVPNANVLIETPVLTSCPGTSDAMVNFNVDLENGFAEPAQVSIVDAAGMTYTNGNLPAGDFCVEVRDANGCLAGGDCFVVGSPSQIDVDVAIFDKDCSMDGKITLVDVRGGNGGYTFDWADLPGTDDPRNRDNLNAGTYSVTITDANGCSVEVAGLTVEDNCCDNPPVISNVIVFEANCGLNNGRSEIIMVGAPTDFTYAWSPSVSLNNVAFDIPSGTYTVTITDVNDADCFIVHSFTVGTIDGPMAMVTSTPATCDLADGTATLTPADFTYTWEDNFTGNERDDLAAGFYAVTVTDPDQPDCQDIVTVLVEAANPLEVEVQINALPDCGQNNGSVSLNVTGGSGSYNFSWGADATRDDLSSGVYTVLVTDVLWGCTSTVNFILNDNIPGVQISLTTTDVSCIGAQDGAIEFELTLDSGFATPPVTRILQNGIEQMNGALGAGEYCLEVRDANGCVAGGICFEINEPSQLDVDIAVVGADCNQGGTIDLEVSGSVPPYTFNWQDLAGMDNPEDRTGLAAGAYQVIITDANACSVVVESLIVEDLCNCTSPVVSSVVVVEATCGNAWGRATVNVAGGPGGFVYTWEGGISTTHQAFDLLAGTYAVTIADPNDATCMVEEVFTIGNSDGPIFDLTQVDANCGANDGVAVFSPTNFEYQWSIGGTMNFRDDLAPGTYQVTITNPDEPECFDVQTVDIGQTNNLEVDFEVLQLPDCNEANGSVQLTVGNGSGNYGYSWGGDATMNNLSSGIYEVTVTDLDSGCEQALTFALLDNVAQAIVNVSGTPEMSCPGSNNGQIDFTLTGGFAQPALTEIRDIAGNVYTNGSLAAGSYCLLVTDANGCLAGSHCFVIKDPEQIDVDIAIRPETCIELGSIELVSVTGGSGDYAYTWSDIDPAPTPTNRTGLSGGDYGLTVTDTNGCSVAETLNVNDFAYNVMISLDATNISCYEENNGAINTSVVNAADPLTINWEHGPEVLNLTNLSPGMYTVTITDANQCSGTATVNIEQPAAIELQLPADTTICEESILVMATTNVGGLSFNWTDADGMPIGSNSAILVEPDSFTTVFVEVTDASGCAVKDSVKVTNGQPAIELQAPMTTCVDGDGLSLNAINLLPGQILTYEWSPASAILSGGDTPNPTVATNTAGVSTFEVEVENQFGCSLTESVSITVIDTTSVPDILTNWMCEELTMNFLIDDESGMNYVLNFGDPAHPDSSTTDLQSSYTYPATGIYTITLSVPGTEACMMPLEKEIEVIDAPFISADFSFDISECSDSAVIDLTDSSTSAFGAINNWSWNFSNNTSSNVSNPSIVVNENQVLVVDLTVTNEFGCEAMIQNSIPVNIVTLNFPDTLSTCPNTPVALNPSAAEGLIYTWTPTTFLDDPTAANPIATVPAGTTITYEAFVTDSMEVCSKLDQVTVVVNDEMMDILQSDDQSVCQDTTLVLSAFNDQAVSYAWLDENNMVVGNEPNLSVASGGLGNSQTFIVRLEDAAGCLATDTINISNTSIELTEPLEEIEICRGEEVTLVAQAFSPLAGELTYSWSPETGITGGSTDLSEIVVQPDESTTYTYEVENEFGCRSTQEIDVFISDISDLIEASTDRDTIFRGEVAQLTATENMDYTYEWMPAGSLSNEVIFDPQATPEETTDYAVIVTDEVGCTAMASVRVTVLNPDCEEPFIFLPNAFTPNGDGFNDILFLRVAFEVDEVYYVIYSRWGEKVFESNSLEDGWNGTFRGEELSSDVYGFYLQVRCGDGDIFTKKGNVTLLR
ncbi:MAG: gliding motility-associated C-terminal domain-containing protein, partial [Bacteroidota bacterium]